MDLWDKAWKRFSAGLPGEHTDQSGGCVSCLGLENVYAGWGEVSVLSCGRDSSSRNGRKDL